MIGGIHENWDGTGHPRHDLQGQIPLRCRILRVVLDFTAMVDGPSGQPIDAVLERIEDHAGTHYDPMVVVHLKNLVGGLDERHWRGASVLLPIDELRVGMVLAEDLYTDSGLKLLTSGTTLTSATLQVIQRRHRVEPLEHGAAVLRESAA